MIIRKAKLKDAPAVLELWKEFMGYQAEMLAEKDYRMKPHLEKKKNAPEIFFKYLNKCLKSKDYLVNVAEDKGKLVGYNLLGIKNNVPIFRIEKTGHFHDLFVKKEYRGKKISSMLKEEAVKWFKKKGVKYLSIDVYSGNEHAHNIYKKWGFFDYHIGMRKRI
jgi:GNAT superfamily N-acetyltransferase